MLIMSNPVVCINCYLNKSQRLKNKIDPLLFYGEHFYGFSESDFENIVKKISFHNKHIYIYRS